MSSSAAGAQPELEHLAGVAGDVLTGRVDPTDALASFVQHAVGVDGVDAAVVTSTAGPVGEHRWTSHGPVWVLQASRRGVACLAGPAGTGHGLPDLPNVSATAARSGRVAVDDVARLPDPDRSSLLGRNVRALVTCPLRHAGELYGSVTLARASSGSWDPGLVAGLELFAAAVASVLHVRAQREALEVADARVEEANRGKQRFFATVGHELRTPLAALSGLAEMLTDNASAGRHENLARDLDDLTQTVEHLSAVVETLLGSARLLVATGTGSSVATAAADAVHWVEQQARERDVSVTVDVPGGLAVAMPRAALRQVLSNLVTNAVLYNHPGGQVAVSATMTAPAGAPDHGPSGRLGTPPVVRVAVSDTGPGLSAADARVIWEPFARITAAGRADVPGTGLGLPLAQAIVERFGGRIGVESTPGHGATFWVELPPA